MPRKPRRRDRRRSGGGHASSPTRRPHPAPPISPERIVRQEGAEVRRPTGEPPTTHPPTAPSGGPSTAPSAAAGTSPRLERRTGTSSARALEAQREERVRKEALHDLGRLGTTAGITLVVLTAAVLLLR